MYSNHHLKWNRHQAAQLRGSVSLHKTAMRISHLLFDVFLLMFLGDQKMDSQIDSQNWFPPKKYSKPPFFQRSSLWKPAGLLQNIRIYGLRRLASQFEVHVSLSPHVAPAASACCWRHWRRNHPANFDRFVDYLNLLQGDQKFKTKRTWRVGQANPTEVKNTNQVRSFIKQIGMFMEWKLLKKVGW